MVEKMHPFEGDQVRRAKAGGAHTWPGPSLSSRLGPRSSTTDCWSASCCWVDFLACVGSRLTGQGLGGPAAAGELVAGQGCWVGGSLRGRIWTRQRRCWVEWTCSGGLAYPSGSSGIGVWSSLRFCRQQEGSLATGPTPHPLGRFVKLPHYSPFHIR